MRLRFALAAWSNAHFDQALYYPGTPHAEQLPRYARLLDAAEADVLHHRLPSASLLGEWCAQTPEGFAFLPKMHKAVTHGAAERRPGPPSPQDQDSLEVAREFMAGLDPLRRCGRLGPVLLQFPPRFTRETGWDLLLGLLSLGPAGTFACEFRHPSWFVPAAREVLEDFEAPLVWSTYPKAFAPPWSTAPHGYVRFTGSQRPRHGRHVTVADRLPDVLEMRKRLQQASWPECFVVVTNPFEGNAVDSLPRIAAALGAEALAGRMKREPGVPLLAWPDLEGPIRKAAKGGGRRKPAKLPPAGQARLPPG